MALDRFFPTLHAALGVFLPLIAVNCAILGASLLMVERGLTLPEAAVFGFGSGVGWLLAIAALAGIRERLRYHHIPAGLRGLGITFLLTGLMAIGFLAFGGDSTVTTVLLGVAGFTGVILALVVVLLYARKRLVATGEVTIRINDDPEHDICTPAGGTLLGTLAANGLFIPSACGGKGSCGVLHPQGAGRRRRRAADRAQPPHPGRGARGGPALLPGQGEAGRRDRGGAGTVQRAPVEVPGPVEPQRRDLHQGVGARASRRGGGPLPGGRLHPDRVPAVLAELRGLRRRGRVPGRLGPLQHVAVQGHGGRGRGSGAGLLDGQLSGGARGHPVERPDRLAAAPDAGRPRPAR